MNRRLVKLALTLVTLSWATSLAQAPAMVDLGGYKVNFTCEGPVTPLTVVVIRSPVLPVGAAVGDDTHFQASVGADLAESVRTCAYDPPGTGESDPAPRVATAAERAEELHRVLVKVRVRSRVVLVTDRFSSQLARLFTSRHRSDVAGLVLVDPWQEDTAAAVSDFFRRRPLSRVRTGDPNAVAALNALSAFVRAYETGRATALSGLDVVAGDREVRSVRSFGALPVVVVTSVFDVFSAAGETGGNVTYGRELANVLRTQQGKLRGVSTNARQMLFDPLDPGGTAISESEVVVEAVRAVLNAAARGRSLPGTR
ncbi:hypothetical protein [Deinococcus pimensis]|uniref:hypothetical protein n=1 Tax=Deinococcus pimensis TaxID=309888 RepID=UPI0004866124|nr:hypothetical protein [Deinococcus pimensis]